MLDNMSETLVIPVRAALRRHTKHGEIGMILRPISCLNIYPKVVDRKAVHQLRRRHLSITIRRQ